MTREIRVFGEEGRTFDPSPTLSHLKRKTGIGLLAGLNLDTSYLPIMCAVEGVWKLIFIAGGNASSNLTCDKYIPGELLVFNTPIVAICPFLAHLERNAVPSI